MKTPLYIQNTLTGPDPNLKAFTLEGFNCTCYLHLQNKSSYSIITVQDDKYQRHTVKLFKPAVFSVAVYKTM